MKADGPIDIRPLTLRGVFGIANRLIARNPWPLLGHAAVYTFLVAALFAAASSPLVIAFIDLGFSGGDGLAYVGAALSTLLLVLIAAAAFALVISPMYTGTLYGELSSRVYCRGGTFKSYFSRWKYSVKRFFLTNLCFILASLVVGAATSFVSSIAAPIFTLSALPAAFSVMPGFPFNFDLDFTLGAGTVVLLVLAVLAIGLLQLCGTVFIRFTYPAAVNEEKRGFDAVGRSLSLVYKRYGRALLALLIFNLAVSLVTALLVAFAAALVLPFAGGSMSAGLFAALASVLGLVFLAFTVYASLYSAALDTVLYFDSRVRLDGPDAMGYPDPSPGEATPDTAPGEAEQQ